MYNNHNISHDLCIYQAIYYVCMIYDFFVDFFDEGHPIVILNCSQSTSMSGGICCCVMYDASEIPQLHDME